MKEKILFHYYMLLWKFASYYIKRTNPYIIWITWSVGKTSARMIIYTILSKYLSDKRVYTSSKNFNWEFGMSLSILWISEYNPNLLWLVKILFTVIYRALFQNKLYDVVLLEYGIDHIWEMDFLLSICRPDFWVLTKIDKVHSLQFSSPDITAKEKYKLIYNSKDVVFINDDDEYSKQIDYDKLWWVEKFIYSSWDLVDKKLDINVSDQDIKKIDWEKVCSVFELWIRSYNKIKITSSLIWKESMWYVGIWLVMLDILFSRFYWNSFLEWKVELNIDLEFQPWRFWVFEWIKSCVIIDSSYNAAPWSMRRVIDNVINIRNKILQEYKIIFVLWDMRELWDYTQIEHENLAEFIYDKADEFFLVWENMKKIVWPKLLDKKVSSSKIRLYSRSIDAWKDLKNFLESSDEKYLIVFKWSQNTIFLEEAIKEILKDKKIFTSLARQSTWWMEKKNNFFWK